MNARITHLWVVGIILCMAVSSTGLQADEQRGGRTVTQVLAEDFGAIPGSWLSIGEGFDPANPTPSASRLRSPLSEAALATAKETSIEREWVSVGLVSNVSDYVESRGQKRSVAARYTFVNASLGSTAESYRRTSESSLIYDVSNYYIASRRRLNIGQMDQDTVLNADARRAISEKRFDTAFAPGYVESVYSGAILQATFRVEMRGSVTRQEVSTAIGLAAKGLAAGGTLSVEDQAKIEAVFSRTELSAQVYRVGGGPGVDVGDWITLSKADDYAQFAQGVKKAWMQAKAQPAPIGFDIRSSNLLIAGGSDTLRDIMLKTNEADRKIVASWERYIRLVRDADAVARLSTDPRIPLDTVERLGAVNDLLNRTAEAVLDYGKSLCEGGLRAGAPQVQAPPQALLGTEVAEPVSRLRLMQDVLGRYPRSIALYLDSFTVDRINDRDDGRRIMKVAFLIKLDGVEIKRLDYDFSRGEPGKQYALNGRVDIWLPSNWNQVTIDAILTGYHDGERSFGPFPGASIRPDNFPAAFFRPQLDQSFHTPAAYCCGMGGSLTWKVIRVLSP